MPSCVRVGVRVANMMIADLFAQGPLVFLSADGARNIKLCPEVVGFLLKMTPQTTSVRMLLLGVRISKPSTHSHGALGSAKWIQNIRLVVCRWDCFETHMSFVWRAVQIRQSFSTSHAHGTQNRISPTRKECASNRSTVRAKRRYFRDF